MNVVITTILAVIVLVVLAVIFTGGVGNAYQRILSVFNLGITSYDLEYVTEQCRILCDQAEELSDGGSNPQFSGFCNAKFNFDRDFDGVIENIDNAFTDERGVTCSEVSSITGVSCQQIVTCSPREENEVRI